MRRGLRRFLIVLGAFVALAAVTAALVWGVFIRLRGQSASRRAADAPCAPDYVQPETDPAGTSVPALRVETVAHVEQPTTVAWWPSGNGIGVVGDRAGKLYAIRDGQVDGQRPLVDVSDKTEQEGDGGLLTAVYDPKGDWLYVWRATEDLDDLLEAYPSPGGVPQASGRKQLLFVDHPHIDQHHGGGLAFGPDGYLYIGTGDGGGLGDPAGNGQKLSTLQGKLLRIAPTPDGPKPYTIPPDNPFVNRSGARPEIFAYGLRNPFRLSFDGDDLWLPDVGHSCWEEINYEADVARDRSAGAAGGWNFGWDVLEGAHHFQGDGNGPFENPLTDYSHQNGHCVVVGGYRYRGDAIPALDGGYLYSDYCNGRLNILWYRPGEPLRLEATNIHVDRPVAIDPGPDGEPWILSLEGEIVRLVPA
jgi:glucose/arabinose dehydrogenase